MELNPNPEVHKKLKQMAAKEGISLNAMLVPFLNEIARGELVRVAHYPPPTQQSKAA